MRPPAARAPLHERRVERAAPRPPAHGAALRAGPALRVASALRAGSVRPAALVLALVAALAPAGAARVAGDEAAPAVRPRPGMPWQRTLDDALELVRRTGKPLLVCVNTDGEPASESLAAERYRDPEFLRLASGFIPVLASPDRRTPRDHDGRGVRLVDETMGRLVNGEHIRLEPLVFERWFGGTRVAPRHLAVSADGEVLFDLYLLHDLRAIDDALARHGVPGELPDPARLDEAALLDDPDAAAREHLEARFAAGDTETRTRLTWAALDPDRSTQHPELLRMALRDAEPEVRRAAARLAGTYAELVPLELLGDAARVAAGDEAASRLLADGLARVAASATGEDAVRARRLGRIVAAGGARSDVVDAPLWQLALASATTSPPGAAWTDVVPPGGQGAYALIGAVEERVAAAPDDARLRALLAEVALRAAERLIADGETRDAGTVLADAEHAARVATGADPTDAAAWATLAWAGHLQGDAALAADAAVRAVPRLLGHADGQHAADALLALAHGRHRALQDALGGEQAPPASWIADLVAAWDVLGAHPRATESELLAGLDALARLELHAAFERLLDAGLERHPASTGLHEYLRWHALESGPADALGVVYDRWTDAQRARPDGDEASALWFDGYARLLAAERLVENRRPDAALRLYGEAAERFGRSYQLEPAFENALLHAAQAWSGAARVHLQRGDLAAAAHAVREGARTSADAALTEDGLGQSPARTARAVLDALRRDGWGWLADDIATELEELGFGSGG